MEASKNDKLHIELYACGVFQGYAKHVSEAKQKIESTQYKSEALSFSTESAANRVCDKIINITDGCLMCSVR